MLIDVFLRRVLIVDDKSEAVARLTALVRDCGGEPLKPVSALKDFAAMFEEGTAPDLALVSIDCDVALPVVRRMRRHGIPVVWVIGQDEWLADNTPTLFRHESDPENVVRVKASKV